MVLLIVILLPLLLGTVLTSWVGRLQGGLYRAWTAICAGLVTLASLGLLLQQAPQVFAGQTLLEHMPWVPELGLNLSFRLDGLSLMFGLLITGIGLLIITYAHFYLSKNDSAAKFYSLMMLFMSAMLGIVLSDNLLVLLVFWELTSISSFLLVGYWGEKQDARTGARMALAVTGGGGLLMLAGFVLLGHMAGTYEISALSAHTTQIQQHALFVPMLLLILLGCFTKSAQFPFHFWLPDAMAAPTPVSAYLHSATMVKAGVFLLARLYPVFAGAALFEWLVTGTGLITVCFAALIAIFKHDLKGLLAYSTISHLGLIVFLIGLGSPLAALAAMFHVLNHATFKAALFMVAGIIDHETGSRDLRKLGGLYALMPWTATLAMVAAAGMAGIPLTGGFLSKEMFFTEALAVPTGVWQWGIGIAVTIAGLCSAAYSFRLIHDSFFNPALQANGLAELPNPKPHDPPWGMRLPVLVLVVLSLAVGLLPSLTFGPMVFLATAAMIGQPLPDYHIALWHGFNLPLLMSAVAVLGGAALYFGLNRGGRLHRLVSEDWFGPVRGKLLFDRLIDGLFRLAGLWTMRLENGSLQRYLAWFFGAALVAAVLPVIGVSLHAGDRVLVPATWPALALWLLLLGACAALLQGYRKYFRAVVLVGVIGLVTSLAFVGLSAPDLALTQLSVEIVSTAILLMGLALLPQSAPMESTRRRRVRDAVLALAGGAGIGWLAWLMLTRDHSSISWFFLQNSLPKGGGTNVVNVILVDFRGYDTFGEITVLAIAAIGVLALMDGFHTHRSTQDPAGRAWSFRSSPLLLRVSASIVLPLALVFSLYIFMRGHNMPGGGFIAGLITAVALVMQYMALGQQQAEYRLQAGDGRLFEKWIGFGLLIAGLTGLAAFIWGKAFLSSAHAHPHVPILGDIPLASAALFDLGVYLTVVGSTLLTLSVLGGASLESRQQHTGEAP